MDELRLGPLPAGRGGTDTAAWLRGLQPGQVVRAQVLDSAGGAATLSIGGRQVSAATEVFLPRGAWLNLVVTALTPTLTVTILQPAARRAQAQSPLEQHFQTLLPRQGSVVAPLQALLDPSRRVNLLSLPGVGDAALDSALEELLPLGPPRSAEALRKALAQSGVYYEAGQALRGAQPAAVDLKALLLRLLARIERAQGERLAAGQPLAELARSIDGALATIALNQLVSTPYPGQDTLYWVFQIPFRLGEQVHGLAITLARGAAGEEEEQREWKALLALDLPWLGSIEAEVFLRGSRVSLVIYSQRGPSVGLLEAALPGLQAAFEAAGLQAGVLRVHHGPRARSELDQPPYPGVYRRA